MATDWSELRVGNGVDVHAFASGRRLILGGVEVPHLHGLAGHSDADVAVHAIIDALLGAAALGDIGRHFPSNDARWRDANSLDLLRTIAGRLAEHGWRANNIDVTIVAERPKLAPHVPAMRQALAATLNLALDRLSVKATTSDRLGFTGRGEGIAALATATIVR